MYERAREVSTGEKAPARLVSAFDPFALQRLAGNRATAAWLQGLALQRKCGPACACDTCGGSSDTVIQRQAMPVLQRVVAPGTFDTTLTPVDNTVSVKGSNAADWNANAISAIGGEGGKVEVQPIGSVETSISDAGVIDGATAGWTVTKSVATVDESGFTNDGEKVAAKALADRVAKHEDTHKTNELTGRKDFAKTLKGKKDSEVDKAVNAQECKVGKTQRTLDNAEGVITLNSANEIVLSGKDHKEYESSC